MNLEEVPSQSPRLARFRECLPWVNDKTFHNIEDVVAAFRDMPQALSAVYVHLVFSTKERRPYFRNIGDREALHSFLGSASKELDCAPILIGGVEDHVHILARLGRTITQADWVKELKRVSNKWLKERGPEYADFEWQGGYAIFAVSASNLEPVKKYI